MNIMKILLLGINLLFVISNTLASPTYVFVGTITNKSDPSEWESFSFDITSFVNGSISAFLSVDLRNDASNPPFEPDPTTSNVYFGVDGEDYFVHFDYRSGGDTSHWRNVILDIDGVIYKDQYKSYNNHLGDEYLGTSWMGSSVRNNIMGDSSYDATTYVMSKVISVSEPSIFFLLGIGVTGWFVLGGRKL